jgi:hypothetical protein
MYGSSKSSAALTSGVSISRFLDSKTAASRMARASKTLFVSGGKIFTRPERTHTEEGLEPSQGYPYRILSSVADATKVRRDNKT